MTETTDAPVDERRIRTAEDLLVALRDPDLQVRASLLVSLLEQPAVALRFGAFQGVDLIDELIDQTFRTDIPAYRHLVTATLAVLEDSRVPAHFRKLLRYAGEPDLLRVIEERLMREPVDPGFDLYRTLAMQIDSVRHAVVAANILTRGDSLDARLAIRVSVANTLQVDRAGDVDGETLSAWIEELDGPFMPNATLLLEARGASAFQSLTAGWSNLNDEAKSWIVEWGTRSHPLDAVPVVRAAIHDKAEPVVVAGLRAVERMGPAGQFFASELAPLTAHESGRVRTLALSAGAPIASARDLLGPETAPEVIAELLHRLRKEEGEAAVDTLVAMLSHEDYRVRVQALTELVALGEVMEERAKAMVLGDERDLRVAGTNLLLALGRQEWLESHLLG